MGRGYIGKPWSEVKKVIDQARRGIADPGLELFTAEEHQRARQMLALMQRIDREPRGDHGKEIELRRRTEPA